MLSQYLFCALHFPPMLREVEEQGSQRQREQQGLLEMEPGACGSARRDEVSLRGSTSYKGLTQVQLAALLLGLRGSCFDGPLSLRMSLEEGLSQGGRAWYSQGHDAVHSLAFGPSHFGAVFGGCQQDQFGELSGLPGGCWDHICARLGSWLLAGLHVLTLLLTGLELGHPRTNSLALRPHSALADWSRLFLLLPGQEPGSPEALS